MAQFMVRNLENDIRDKLRARAEQHGRSMEEEVREILREAVLKAPPEPETGLGTRLVQLFADCQLDEPLAQLPTQPPRPAEFSE